MLGSITILFLCQLAGEAFVRGFGLPIPGAVIGMVLLFIGLCIKGGVPDPLDSTVKGILTNMSLLFVPAGVGLVTKLDLLAANWLPIILALTLGTAVTMLISAATVIAVARIGGKRRPEGMAP